MYQSNDEEWKALLAALDIGKGQPIPEYKILQMATKRILYLEEDLANEHKDCIKTAREVLPESEHHFHYAHQCVWALVYEVRKLRGIREQTK